MPTPPPAAAKKRPKKQTAHDKLTQAIERECGSYYRAFSESNNKTRDELVETVAYAVSKDGVASAALKKVHISQ